MNHAIKPAPNINEMNIKVLDIVSNNKYTGIHNIRKSLNGCSVISLTNVVTGKSRYVYQPLNMYTLNINTIGNIQKSSNKTVENIGIGTSFPKQVGSEHENNVSIS